MNRVRVLIGALALGVAWVLPHATLGARLTMFLLVALVYLPWALVVLVLAGRGARPWTRLVTLAGDVLVVFLFQATLPQTRVVALFGYLMMVAFYAPVAGPAVGSAVAAASTGLTALAEIAWPDADGLSFYTIAMFAGVQASLVLLLTTVRAEQRRANSRLHALHESLEAVSSSLALPDILDAIAHRARESLGATVTCCYLMGPDGALIAAWAGAEYDPAVDHVKQAFDPKRIGGSGLAHQTGEPVVVENVHTDPRFEHWREIARTIGLSAMVAAPIVTEGAGVGTLSLYFNRPRRISSEDVELVRAYAGQAAVAAARGLAFERERDAADKARALDQMKSDFVATVSHELRTPLTVIEGFCQTLIGQWDALGREGQLDGVRRIKRNSDELHRLVEQLLDLSRLESGWSDIHPRPIRLREAVTRALEAHEPALASHSVALEVPGELEIHADEDGFQRIIRNLIGNAAKYSPPGTPIVVSASTDGLDAVVSVADRGPGIPPDEQARIFDPFFQGSRRQAGRLGTGIGLTIARRYVELHGGRIWFRTEPGEGTVFSFSMPRANVTRRPPSVRLPRSA